ncbi:MAG TPA: DotA/TraY family protein, partial [Hyphomicrobium zavarzinii]|nr:DotA/TraY family protein [Hyphomicrobium zavarzinii]
MSSEGVFTPVGGDLALGLMRRTLGCVVSQIWQGEACSNAGLISTIAGVFNVGIAVIAGALVTWSVYRAMFDTARTGAAGGEASTGYSVLRIGLGAVLLLPVAAGFTLAQLLVVQLLVWGSGFADTVWSKTATVIQGGGYTTTAVKAGNIDPRLRGELAAALYVRTAGYICADSLNSFQAMMGGAGAQVAATNGVSGSAGWFGNAQTRTWGFSSGPYWYNSASLCGAVSYTLSPESAPVSAQAADDLGTYEALNRLANQAVAVSMQSAMQVVDTHARELASAIEAGHDMAAAKQKISAGVQAASVALQNGMQSAISSGDIDGLAAKYLETSSAAGWAMAPAWQRAMANVANKVETLKRAVTLNTSSPEPLDTYIYGAFQSSTFRTIFDENMRSMNALQALSGYVADFGRVNPTGGAGSAPQADDSAGLVAGAMRAMLSTFSIESDDTKFVDPFAALQSTGAALSYAAAGSKVAGLALDWLPATRVASAVSG